MLKWQSWGCQFSTTTNDLKKNGTEVQKYTYIFFTCPRTKLAHPVLTCAWLQAPAAIWKLPVVTTDLCFVVFSGSTPFTLFLNRNWNTQNNLKYLSDWPIFPIPKLKYNIFQNFCFGEQNAWINTKRIMTSFSSLSGRFSRQQRNIGEVPVAECGWDVYLHLHLLVSRNYVQLLRLH